MGPTPGQKPGPSPWQRCRREVSEIAGVSAPRPASHSRQGVSEPGAEASLEKIPTGNGQDGPAMRPKHPPAAGSGVGEHTARESEAPNRVPSGKSAWRTPTPKFGPGAARLRGLIFFEGRGASDGVGLPKDCGLARPGNFVSIWPRSAIRRPSSNRPNPAYQLSATVSRIPLVA